MVTMPGDNQPGAVEPPEDVVTDLPDLTGLTLAEIAELAHADYPGLDRALRRVVARHEDSADPIVAFQSSI